MIDVAVTLRTLQLFAHNAHNLVSGSTFAADHAWLGELYGDYEEAYDAIAERCIGTGAKNEKGEPFNPATALSAAALNVEQLGIDHDADGWFTSLLAGERNLCSQIDACILKGGLSEGTLNLISQTASDSECRQYKMQQRLGKPTE